MPRRALSKRGLTLDLNAPATKKTRLQQAAAAAPVLTTPDVQMLKLSSPELAKFLTSSNSLPSGGTLPTPTAGSGTYLFPKNVTEEQELYAKGFEEALNNLKSQDSTSAGGGGFAKCAAKAAPRASSTPNTAAAIDAIERATSAHNTRAAAAAASAAAAGMGGQIPTAVSDIPSVAAAAAAAHSGLPLKMAVSRPPSGASGSIDSSECDSVEIKEELPEDKAEVAAGSGGEAASPSPLSLGGKRKRSSGSAASSASASSSAAAVVSPIDMKDQEKIKLERKRMRNRLAATKCRKRKLERISHLDDRVSVLKGENAELAAVVKRLKASVCGLKQEVMEHINSGCQIMIADDSAAFS